MIFFMEGGTTMVIRRRSLFKIAAGGMLLFTGGPFLLKENGLFWNIWHHLRYRIAMNTAPTRNPDIITKKRGRETILSSRSQHADIMLLNPMAGRIWEMCDGSNQIVDMIHSFTNRFDVVTSECTLDVMFTITQLKQRGLLRT